MHGEETEARGWVLWQREGGILVEWDNRVGAVGYLGIIG